MIGFVINYCSNEKPFIDALLKQCSLITQHIAVSYGSHLYDGTQEDNSYVTGFLRRKYPHVKFLEYKVDIQEDMYKKQGVVKRPTAYWCNLARWIGIEKLEEVDWFFLIDADEIPDAAALMTWLQDATLEKDYAYKLANYWYFKDVVNQATTFEDSILLIHRSHLTTSTVFHDDERDGILSVSGVKQHRMVMGRNGPMFHHFSWVRSKDGLAKKLRTWAHRDDIFKNAPVDNIVGFIYKDDNVNDIIHRYNYKKVENMFDINLG